MDLEDQHGIWKGELIRHKYTEQEGTLEKRHLAYQPHTISWSPPPCQGTPLSVYLKMALHGQVQNLFMVAYWQPCFLQSE